MLGRPNRLELRRLRERSYRQRVRTGLRAAPVEYDADLLDFLIRTGWLADADAGDKHKIGTAISAVMRDAARG